MERLIQFVRRWWNELGFLFSVTVLWLVSPRMLHMLDARAGTYDQGILQVMFFSVLQLAFYAAVSWVFLRFTFPWLFGYFQGRIIDDFQNLNPCVKVILSLSLFAFVLLVLAIMSRVL